MRKIEMGGWGDNDFPYFSGGEIPMENQSDYGLAAIINGWGIQEKSGDCITVSTETEEAEAKTAWLKRYPNPLENRGNKRWAVWTDEKARKG